MGMVRTIFNLIDKDKSESITTKDIEGFYNVSRNKDFLDGKISEKEAYLQFLNSYDGPDGNDDGVITWEEF